MWEKENFHFNFKFCLSCFLLLLPFSFHSKISEQKQKRHSYESTNTLPEVCNKQNSPFFRTFIPPQEMKFPLLSLLFPSIQNKKLCDNAKQRRNIRKQNKKINRNKISTKICLKIQIRGQCFFWSPKSRSFLCLAVILCS